jgi:hypothetical protein
MTSKRKLKEEGFGRLKGEHIGEIKEMYKV